MARIGRLVLCPAGLSLRARTMLLASLGVGGLLVADAALRLHGEREAGRAGLAERAALLATMQADALSVPLWNLDADLLDAALAALMRDPDFAHAEIVKPDGAIIQARRRGRSDSPSSPPAVEVARPILYRDHDRQRLLGALRVGLQTDRLAARLMHEAGQRVFSLVLLLGAVLITLQIAFRQLSRPLDLLAAALGRLASGEQDVVIPELHRDDEVGNVARGLQVFKETAFQLARTQGEYRAIFDNAALGIFRLNAEGQLVAANPALAALLGHEDVDSLRARMKRTDQESLYVQPGRPVQLAALRREHDGYGSQISEIRRADGSTAWVSQTARAVRDGGGRLLGFVGTVEDITQARRRAGEERMRIRAAVECAADAMLIADVDGTPLFVNRAFVGVFGYDLAELAGVGGMPRLLSDHAAGRKVAEALRGGSCRMEAELIARTGRTVPMAISVNPIMGEQAEVVGSVTICTDLSDRRAAEARIAHMAHHDSLTGLPNRAAFLQRLDAMLSDGGPVAVLCIDLDRFKEVNETAGHAIGDLVLQRVAARLAASMREGEMVARVGADEFIAVQRSDRQPEAAETLAARLIAELSRPYVIQDTEIVAGASVGISLFPQDCGDAGGLLRFAALALYEAKAAGRGVARRFTPQMDHALQQRSGLERDLRRAIGEASLEVHYQPQCRATTGAIIGAEALLRWTHPERGPISPAEFIPIAEETGLIGPLGEWVLYTACAAAASWPRRLRVAVNISPAQFRLGDLVAQVRTALASSRLEPHLLELEITEGVMLTDTEATLATLAALKALGIRLAMDDFGTGYSSLSYLRRMPIDKIKIDQSFIRTLGKEEAAIALVRSIIGIGRGLGIEANAEGVETEEQAALLRQEGCHEVQGWYFGRPCKSEVFAAQLGEQARAA